MLKKFFYGMMAATMLVATSCTDEPMLGGDEATVSFSISTPEIATRAFSDGTTATQLQYAVYDGETLLTSLQGTTTINNGTANIQLQLKTGKTYKAIFWAAAPNAPYSINWTDKTMTVDYTGALSNDENRDAFYKAQEITVKGDASINVELRRPFAQLNIGTNDMAAATAAGYTVSASKVTVPTYSVLNLSNGKVDENTETDVVFNYAEIPSGETFPVSGYQYLAMNYVLVDDEQELVDITFAYKNEAGEESSRTVGSVPVRRNYRTNIYGSLLTSNQDVNVEIKPGYDGQATLDALQNAALNGGTVELTEDVVLTTPLQVYSTMTINLNGHTITGPNAARDADGNRIHVIINNSNLTITGGTISSIAENGGSAILNNGVLTLNEVTINGAPSKTDTGTASYAVNTEGEGSKLIVNNSTINGRGAIGATEGTKVEINGGTYHTPAVAWGHAIYAIDEGTEVVINGGTFSEGYEMTANNWGMYQIYSGNKAKVIVKGGNFEPWDCANGYDLCTASEGVIEIYGGTFAENPSNQNKKNYVADGYNVVETEVNGVKYYTVVKEGTNVENAIVSASQLKALGNTELTGTYNLLADIDMTGYDMEPIMLKSGSNNSLVFNGNGHTIKNLNLVAATQNGMSVSGLFNVMHSGKDITVNDLRLVDAKSESGKYSAVVLAYNSTSTVIINLNNVEVNGANISAETVSPLVGYTTAPVNLQNCKVANISMTGEKPEKIGAYVGTANTNGCVVTVTNCTNNTEYKGAGRVINGASMIIDGKYLVANADELSAAVKKGATNIFLQDGEYDIKDCGGKTLNLFGSQKAVLILKDEGESGCDYAFQNGNVTFNGLTINTTQNGGSYKGFAYMKGVFNNCNFVGSYSLNSANDFEFKNCTFDFKNGYFWTWAAKSVTFDGCTFNGNSKTILAHGYASTEISINNCTFAAQEKGFTGSGDNTACVEIDPAGSNTYTINFTGNNTKTDKYAGWIRVKDGSTGHVINGI